MRKEGLEPPYPFGYQILSLARLPVPPLSRSKQPTTPSLAGLPRATAMRARLRSLAFLELRRCGHAFARWPSSSYGDAGTPSLAGLPRAMAMHARLCSLARSELRRGRPEPVAVNLRLGNLPTLKPRGMVG